MGRGTGRQARSSPPRATGGPSGHAGRPRAQVAVPAVLSGKPVQGDAAAATGTPKKPLLAIVPVVVVLLADAGLQRPEVGVGALHRGTEGTRVVSGSGGQPSAIQSPPWGLLVERSPHLPDVASLALPRVPHADTAHSHVSPISGQAQRTQ